MKIPRDIGPSKRRMRIVSVLGMVAWVGACGSTSGQASPETPDGRAEQPATASEASGPPECDAGYSPVCMGACSACPCKAWTCQPMIACTEDADCPDGYGCICRTVRGDIPASMSEEPCNGACIARDDAPDASAGAEIDGS